jgi:hypothetical protein
MRHEDKGNKEMVFTAYLHCKQCGCTVSARIFLKVAREPFDKNKLQENNPDF